MAQRRNQRKQREKEGLRTLFFLGFLPLCVVIVVHFYEKSNVTTPAPVTTQVFATEEPKKDLSHWYWLGPLIGFLVILFTGWIYWESRIKLEDYHVSPYRGDPSSFWERTSTEADPGPEVDPTSLKSRIWRRLKKLRGSKRSGKPTRVEEKRNDKTEVDANEEKVNEEAVFSNKANKGVFEFEELGRNDHLDNGEYIGTSRSFLGRLVPRLRTLGRVVGAPRRRTTVVPLPPDILGRDDAEGIPPEK